MRRRAFGVLMGLAITSFSPGASAQEQPTPSFDCKKASTGLEALICSDAALAQADREMAHAYQEAMAVSTAPEWLRLQQKTWLQTLSARSRCDIPAKAGEPIRDPSFTKKRCEQEYMRRIAKLRAWKDAETGDCATAVSFGKQFICAESELKAKEQRLDETVAALVQNDDDPLHRRQLQRQQVQWRAIRYARRTVYEPCSGEKARAACINDFHNVIDTRQALMDALAKRPTLPESHPIDIPAGWWGVDVRALPGGEQNHVLAIYAGPNRQPLLMVSGAITDPKTGRFSGYQNSKLVNAITGDTVTDEAQSPDVFHAGGKVLKDALDRLGITPDDSLKSAFAIQGHIPKPKDRGANVSPHFHLAMHGDNCPRPVRYPIHYFPNNERLLPTDGRQIMMEHGRYFLRPLAKPEREDWKGQLACDEYDEAAWSFRYQIVTPRGDEWVRLADGTLLAILDSRYVVRFLPDLTSPFFYGRSDIVSVTTDTIDVLDGGVWHPLFVKAVEAILDAAIKEQRTQYFQ